MRSRLFGLGIAVVLPAVALPLFCLPPAHAEEELTARWEKGNPQFAQRKKADGTYEYDKDKDEKGGTTTFNLNNLEVKCQAQRADGDAPKSATGSARYLQQYHWNPYGTTTPPSQYFVIDYTQGTECHANPFSDTSIADATQRAGKATSGGDLASANNEVRAQMDANQRSVTDDHLVDLGTTSVFVCFLNAPVSASAKADSVELIKNSPPQ